MQNLQNLLFICYMICIVPPFMKFYCNVCLVELINGYMKNLSTVSPSRDRKSKYFQFTLQTKDEERRVVSFSPEKHKLLSKIQAKNTNCELRKCRSNSKEEIIINDFTSVKEIEKTFEKKEKKRSFVSVAFVSNDLQL